MKLLTMPSRTKEFESNIVAVSPDLYATQGNLAYDIQACATERAVGNEDAVVRAAPVFRVVLSPQTAFYRSYTEGMLRRYGVLSMEGGRVPSLLGREMFRGRVTNYRVHAFDDVVIFVHDVEQCIGRLRPDQQRLILRIGIQEYTFAEAARMFGLLLRSLQRRYFEALDELTSVFLKRRLLERIATDTCQEGNASVTMVSASPKET